MHQAEIKLKEVKVKNLFDIACRFYSNLHGNEVIPINKKRALAHVNNPYADTEDIGLITAHLEDRCIGYIGLMPGLLKVGRKFAKVLWLSTWFVPPQYRRTSAGLMLIMRAMSLKYDLVVSDMSDEAEKVYRCLHFKELGPLDYYVINFNALNIFDWLLRLVRKVLREIGFKDELPAGFLRFLAAIYAPVKRIIYKGLLFNQKEDAKNITYEEVGEIYENRLKRPTENNSTHFYRGEAVINWMINYKWTPEASEIEPSDYQYYFANIQDVFRYIVVNVYDNSSADFVGYVILSFASKNNQSLLKILDYDVANDSNHEYVLQLALKYADSYQASRIEVPESLLPLIKHSYFLRFLAQKKSEFTFVVLVITIVL